MLLCCYIVSSLSHSLAPPSFSESHEVKELTSGKSLVLPKTAYTDIT